MKRARGFTLMEVMVVLAIIGGLIALAAPYLTNRNSKIKSFLRHMVVMSRDLHTRAKLQGATYRLVMDLKPVDQRGGTKPVARQWWVERSNGRANIKANEEEFAKKKPEVGQDKVDDPRGFAIDPYFSKGPQDMPMGLSFESVEIQRVKDPVREDKAFINYLPEGLVDEAAIHIKSDSGQQWTLAIHPLTGKAELIPKNVSLRELHAQ